MNDMNGREVFLTRVRMRSGGVSSYEKTPPDLDSQYEKHLPISLAVLRSAFVGRDECKGAGGGETGGEQVGPREAVHVAADREAEE